MSDFSPKARTFSPEEIERLIRRFGDPHEQAHSMAERFNIADALRFVTAEVKILEQARALQKDGRALAALDLIRDSGNQLPVCRKCGEPARVYNNDLVCAGCWPDTPEKGQDHDQIRK